MIKILRTLLYVGFVAMLMLMVRDDCCVTGKYIDFAHRDGNMEIKSNHKINRIYICKN